MFVWITTNVTIMFVWITTNVTIMFVWITTNVSLVDLMCSKWVLMCHIKVSFLYVYIK